MAWVSADIDVAGLCALGASMLAAHQARRARQAASRTERKASTDAEVRAVRDAVGKVNAQLGMIHAESTEVGRTLFGTTSRLSAQMAAHADSDHEAFQSTARTLVELRALLAEQRERIAGIEARIDRIEGP